MYIKDAIARTKAILAGTITSYAMLRLSRPLVDPVPEKLFHPPTEFIFVQKCTFIYRATTSTVPVMLNVKIFLYTRPVMEIWKASRLHATLLNLPAH